MPGPPPARPGPPVGARSPARPWWLGLAVLALGGVWLRGALSLPQGATYAVIGPGLFPAVVAVGLLALGGLLLLAVARGERFEPQETEDADPGRAPSRRAFWMTVAGSAVPIVLVRHAGFPVTAAVAFALVARAFGSDRLVHDLAVGLALGVACWLLFARFLGLSLPALPGLVS